MLVVKEGRYQWLREGLCEASATKGWQVASLNSCYLRDLYVFSSARSAQRHDIECCGFAFNRARARPLISSELQYSGQYTNDSAWDRGRICFRRKTESLTRIWLYPAFHSFWPPESAFPVHEAASRLLTSWVAPVVTLGAVRARAAWRARRSAEDVADPRPGRLTGAVIDCSDLLAGGQKCVGTMMPRAMEANAEMTKAG